MWALPAAVSVPISRCRAGRGRARSTPLRCGARQRRSSRMVSPVVGGRGSTSYAQRIGRVPSVPERRRGDVVEHVLRRSGNGDLGLVRTASRWGNSCMSASVAGLQSHHRSSSPIGARYLPPVAIAGNTWELAKLVSRQRQRRVRQPAQGTTPNRRYASIAAHNIAARATARRAGNRFAPRRMNR